MCSCFSAPEPHVRAVYVCECVCTCLLETDQLTTRETAHHWYFSNSAQATFVHSFLLCDESNDSVESSLLLSQSLILVVLLIPQQGNAHPQCLDFKPPFQPPEPLLFCKEYAKFGCCDLDRDNQISQRFYQIMDYFDHTGFMACGKYIRSILCQVSLRSDFFFGILKIIFRNAHRRI